jgi:AraC family transcriptional regulator, transcriptional activator of pobA
VSGARDVNDGSGLIFALFEPKWDEIEFIHGPEIAAMAHPVPNYELYGEAGDSPMPDILHCESIAERSRLHNGQIKPHRHQGLTQVLYSQQGRIEATIDDESWSLTGRFLIALPAMCVHGFDISAETEGWVITVPNANLGDIFESAPRLQTAFERPLVFFPGRSDFPFDRAEEILRQIEAEFTGHAAGRQFALRSCIGLVLMLIARAAADPMPSGLSIRSRQTRNLARFRDLIEGRFREHLPLAAYAAEIGLTTTHLNRICRRETGKSALQIIHERCVIEAKRDLVYSEMTIGEIAAILGFKDPAYFTRFFIRRAGISPGRYRSRARAEILAAPPPPARAA